MNPGQQNPNGPYDPQPRPSGPDVNPVLPGHTPTEVPVRNPEGIPAIDPDRPPGPNVDPAPAAPQPATDPQPRA